MYLETGASARKNKGFRKCFSSKQDALKDIKVFSRYGDVYITVYGFTQAEMVYRCVPVYQSAIIDKMFFDVDSYTKDENGIPFYTYEGMNSVQKIDDWCEKHDYRRNYYMSGGGYHVTIRASGDWQNLGRAMFSIKNDLDLWVDTSTLGDLARLRRVPNTLNWSSKNKARSVYCISITRDEMSLSFDKLWKIAQSPRKKKFTYGTFPVNINDFKGRQVELKDVNVNNVPINRIIDNSSIGDIMERNGLVDSDLCHAMRSIMNNKVILHPERLILIKYIKSVLGLSYEECIRFLKALLREQEFRHCIDER